MSTTLVPQVLGKSCWAASLEMFTERQLQQCDLLRTDYNARDPTQAPDFCDPNWQRINRGRYTGNTKIIDEVSTELQRAGHNPVLVDDSAGTPSFAELRSNIRASAIALYSWDTGGDLHFIVPNKTHEQHLSAGEAIQWIKVFDPFPVVRGRTYYLNYSEFSITGWFKGIIYHRAYRAGSGTTVPAFTNADPTRLVQNYIDSLPADMTQDFQRVTRIDASHQILDFEFIVTNTNIKVLIDDRAQSIGNILANARDMKMILAGSGNKYTSFFLNSEGSGYYISTIENGLKYLPVVDSVRTRAMEPAAMDAPVAARPRTARQMQVNYPAEPDDIEKEFIKNFEKKPKAALICRFFDIGQEYVFFMQDGRVRVFDPFKSFAYILSEGKKRPTHISFHEFLNALTQFYPILNKK